MIFFVTDDGAKFVVFTGPREVEVFTLFRKNVLKIRFVSFSSCGKKYSV